MFSKTLEYIGKLAIYGANLIRPQSARPDLAAVLKKYGRQVLIYVFPLAMERLSSFMLNGPEIPQSQASSE